MLDVGLMRVQDRAGIIPAAEEIDLARASEALERATTDQLVVVTVPTLNGKSIEDFSIDLARRMGAGQADKDNGVVLLVAPNEHKVRIEVGYGLEALLTDRRAYHIIQDMIPRFKSGDQGGAIRLGVNEIDALLLSDRRRPQYARKKAA